jgi:hypothetical protein
LVVFATAAACIVLARRQASQPDTAAPELQPQAATAAQDTIGSRATTGAPKPTAVAPVSETTRVASAAAQEAHAITITGCLERNDDKFRLKDTEGENSPQSRSWKAGFLRRSNRAVDVVDTRNRFKLAEHVDERVSATGTLVDGDMRLQSLRRLATSCEKEA